MRRVAERLGIRAPSLYKHVRDKGELEAALISEGFAEVAERFEATGSLAALGAAYRGFALEHPHLYRLMLQGRLPRERLVPGAEERAAAPLIAAVGGDARPRPRGLRVRARDGDPRARRPLPARRRPRGGVGARAQRVFAVASRQRRCSTIRLESQITSRPSSTTGHVALAGQRVDLVAVARAQRDPHRLRLDPAALELARDAAARAEPVRRRAAAVQARGHGTSSPSRRAV